MFCVKLTAEGEPCGRTGAVNITGANSGEAKSRKGIIAFLDIPSAQYALRCDLDPLVESGAILLTMPEKPRSAQQQYLTNPNI